jgi:glycosyltransferase involved in cell wall biosynthesis
MKILVVSSFLPYPLYSGGHVRLFNILKKLSKHHEITLVCEKRPYQTEKDVKELEKICKAVYTIDRKKQWSLQNIFSSGFSSSPFLLVGHTLPGMKKTLAELLRIQSFDVIHIETFYVYQNLPETTIPVVLVEHNIEYLVYKRFSQTKDAMVSWLLDFDVKKIKKWEEHFWQKATKLVAVSPQEKKIMKRSDVEVVPNGVDIEKFQISNFKFQISKREKRVLFIGDFKWIQNRNAVEWILKEIWPKIMLGVRSQKLEVKLWIVSKSIPQDLKELGDNTIIFDENAPEDTEDIFKQADILLAPLRVGGGTSFKILEAMASGVAVVTTPLGIEGIDAKQNKDVLVSNTAAGISDQVLQLLSDETLYKKITQNARKLIEEKYNWDTIVKKLEEVYKSAIS